MTTGSVLLWCFGVLAALATLCWLVSFFRRKLPSEKFDERQKQIRGQANELAMNFGYVYYLVLFASLQLDVPLPLKTESLIILGILMQAMILHIYAMLHNAELPLGKKHGTSILVYGIMGVSQLLTFRAFRKNLRIARLAEVQGVDMLGVSTESASEDTYLTLMFSVIFFTLTAMHLVQYLRDRREGCE